VNRNKLLIATLFATACVALCSALAFAMPGDRFEGAPALDERKPVLAAYIWSVQDREFIRFHSDKPEQQFTGKICSAGSIEDVTRYKLEPSDELTPRRKGTCLYFNLQTGVGVDGFDLHSKGGDITVEILLNGKPLSAKRIFVGPQGKHPRRVPLVKKRS
jgi:hypothetical protein